MSIKALANLPTLVNRAHTSAKASNALVFADSELAIIPLGAALFQLRFCPSLAKKPGAQKKDDGPKKPKPDPFDDPDPSLLITRFSTSQTATEPTHLLVLNKYPIIPNHFILATIENKAQTQLLEEDDLWATYQCILHWEQTGEAHGRLFAFFNSGEHSGASQPHRHVQFLPVQDMKHGDTTGRWQLLMDSLTNDEKSFENTRSAGRGLPFQYFTEELPDNIQPDHLHKAYIRLYDKAEEATRAFAKARSGQSLTRGESTISYNLAMTRSRMLLCPRRAEGKMICRSDGSDIDFVALNGTMLGGTLMVKNAELFELLKHDHSKLSEVLEAVGIPNGDLAQGSSL